MNQEDKHPYIIFVEKEDRYAARDSGLYYWICVVFDLACVLFFIGCFIFALYQFALILACG